MTHRGNDDYEVLQLKNFQGPFTSYPKTFKALFCFQGLSRSWKMDRPTSFKDFQGCVAILLHLL